MKKIIPLLFLWVVSFTYAQIPPGYYSTATGTGYTLKTQLFNKINPHTILVYGSGLWNLYPSSDAKPSGLVWDIYSSCDFIFGTPANGGNQDDGTLGNQECQRFNKEHTFPKSWFGGNSAIGTPMYSDAFHVMPTDKKVNGARGNLAYGIVGTANYTSSNGTKKGNCVAPNYPYSLQVFEPADEYKGDIARNYFYMATCYQDLIGSWQTLDANGDSVLDGSSDKVFEQWYLNMIYSWHIADPVSQKEIDRNNAIYQAQGNRNPFIDRPEYVQMIWGSSLSNPNFNSLSSIILYPNPSTNGIININSNTMVDEIELITINGQIMQKISHTEFKDNTYSFSNLPKGLYFLKVSSNNESITKKVIIN
jgi:endonuclease I